MRHRTDPEEQRARRATADAERVLEAAARSLGGAPKTRKALTQRLTRLGYPEEHVSAAIARLEQVGLIDDERLARALIESRDRSRPRGDRALLQELRRRGVAEDLAASLLAERAGGDDGGRRDSKVGDAELHAAKAAAARIRLRGGDPRVERQRIAQALLRRGFPGAMAWRVAEERLAGTATEPPQEAFDPGGDAG
jgi:regulatory protein